jgi:hypothetical protein
MRELQCEDGKLIFKDYLKRKITIKEEDFPILLSNNERCSQLFHYAQFDNDKKE